MKLTSERQWLRKQIQKSKAEPKDKGKEKKKMEQCALFRSEGAAKPQDEVVCQF